MDEQINITLAAKDLILIHEGLGYLPYRQVEKLVNQIRQILQTTLQNNLQNKEPQ